METELNFIPQGSVAAYPVATEVVCLLQQNILRQYSQDHEFLLEFRFDYN